MPANVFTYRMPAGIPGAVSRAGVSDVEPVKLWPQGTTGAFPGYGLAGVIDATTGEFRLVKSTDAVATGFLVRPYPTNANSVNQALGAGVPMDGLGDRLRKGYMTVKLYGATPAVKGGAVFVRVANAGAGETIGGVEAADDGADAIQLDGNCYFMGPADADGNVEIAYNT